MSMITDHFSWDEAHDSEGHSMPRGVRRNVKRMARLLEKVREEAGGPLRVTSWYRSPLHSRERGKPTPGEHTTGLAVDIMCSHGFAGDVLRGAVMNGIKRIGMKQHGDTRGRFIHLGISPDWPQVPWTYR